MPGYSQSVSPRGQSSHPVSARAAEEAKIPIIPIINIMEIVPNIILFIVILAEINLLPILCYRLA